MPAANYPAQTTNYYNQAPGHQDRSYTLGGDGYGSNSVPPLPEHQSMNSAYLPYPGQTHSSPEPINTNLSPMPPSQTSPIKGPRPQPGQLDDAPPGYDAGSGNVTGAWGKQ